MTEQKRSGVGPLRWIISLVILAVVGSVWFGFSQGDLRALQVVGRSMEPTLEPGDQLIVRRLKEGEPVRGSMVVMLSPDDNGSEMIKRVVAVPGDRIAMRNGVLSVNDAESPPPEGVHGYNPQHPYWQMTLGPDQFFVLGDNRAESHDSTEFGPVGRALFTGSVVWRYGPSGRRGKVK